MSSALQTIDLFDDALRPVPEVLTLRELVGGAVLIVTLLVLGSLWLQFEAGGLAEVRADLGQAQAELARANEQLVQQRGAVTKAMLQAQLDTLQRQRDAQTELLLVAGDSPDAAHGFSDYMSDLADLHPQGLWLDGIELENVRLGDREPGPSVPRGNAMPATRHLEVDDLTSQPTQRVRLQGKTLDPQLVPEFLEALALNSHFSGTRFDRFELASEAAGAHSFAVFSQAEQRNGGAR